VVLNQGREHAQEAHGPVNRLEAAEAALRTERAARSLAERALAEAQAQVQSLRTKLAHAEMAQTEALAAERAARAEALSRAEAAELTTAAIQAELAAAAPVRAAPAATARPAAQAAEVTPPRRRGRPPGSGKRSAPAPAPENEPEPVQWWLPSYRAQARKGRRG
jgi:hypothetical protein